MINLPTPHISAALGEIAKTVIMPGDPLRAKYISDKFLTDVKCFNTVRNMLGFTGLYKGKQVSVMGSGMGNPSIGIYSYELFNFYDVDNIIRVGSAGSINNKVALRDIVIAMGACTNSNYSCQYNLNGFFAPISDYNLLKIAEKCANNLGVNPKIGNVLSNDTLYAGDSENFHAPWRAMSVLAVEMEAAGLYMNAAKAGKNALCIVTISDLVFGVDYLSSEEREKGFSSMASIALDVSLAL